MERLVRTCVLKAVGTNCDEEMRYAFESSGSQAHIALLTDLIEGTENLDNYKILGLPGGFTYADVIRSGVIQANKLRIYLADKINDFINHGGLVIGVCNGFQTLVASGLLPAGKINGEIKAALAFNANGSFRCEWRDLKVAKDSKCVFLEAMPDQVSYPIAHGEGRFYASEDTLDSLEARGMVAFRYCDRLGNPTMQFPSNPNGSARAIAGICDESGRIIGLMPHPERFIRRLQHPNARRPDGPKQPQGLSLFQGMVNFASQL